MRHNYDMTTRGCYSLQSQVLHDNETSTYESHSHKSHRYKCATSSLQGP